MKDLIRVTRKDDIILTAVDPLPPEPRINYLNLGYSAAMYILQISIGSLDTSGLLDTGSTLRLIDSDLAKELGKPLSTTNKRGLSVSGDPIDFEGKVFYRVKIWKAMWFHEFYVMKLKPFSALIGTDCLGILKEISLDFDKQVLKFSTGILKLEEVDQIESIFCIRLTEDMTANKHTRKNILK